MDKVDLAPSIRDAARRHLGTLGLQQKGRSRFWFDDRGWFVIGVEFQPGFGKGTYLNVGCCWLWNPKEYFSFDLGSRELGFESFTSLSEWQQTIDRIAQLAAERVIYYRSLLASPRSLADYFRSHPPQDFWQMYHAGIASALADRSQDARDYLLQAAAQELADSPDWLKQAAKSCRLLLELLHTPALFSSHIIAGIQQTRLLFKLSPVAAPFAV